MRKFTRALVLLVIFSTLLYAGDVSRKGTTGAEQLLIPVGARGIATGGAFISNITGMEAIYYNPAGLDYMRRTEGMFSYMSYIADINVSYIAAGTSLGELGSIALSFKTLDFGIIPVTTFDSPDGTGATYTPQYYVAGLSYSKIITDRVTIGVNAKLINETIMSVNANGFAIDFGVQYRFKQNLSLGAVVKNIGSNMRYSGSDLQVKTPIPISQPGSKPGVYEAVTEPFQIPSYFSLSIAYDYIFNEQNKFVLGTTFTNNNSYEDELKLGLEYGFMNTFFIRGGYNMLMKNAENSIYGLTFGAGVDYNVVEGIGMVFDYAFRDIKDFPTPNHVFTLKIIVN